MEKKRIFKIIMIIILILLVLFIIHIIRNYIIISKIAEMELKLADCKNYAFSIETESENKAEFYCKDNKNIKVLHSGDKAMFIWQDEETKELINYIPEDLKAYIKESEFTQTINIPLLIGYDVSAGTKLNMAISSFITYDKIDDEKCYVVKWGTNAKNYISQEDGKPLKIENGILEKEGEKISSITEYKKWKIDELTDEDVNRPNLTGYDISYE